MPAIAADPRSSQIRLIVPPAPPELLSAQMADRWVLAGLTILVGHFTSDDSVTVGLAKDQHTSFVSWDFTEDQALRSVIAGIAYADLTAHSSHDGRWTDHAQLRLIEVAPSESGLIVDLEFNCHALRQSLAECMLTRLSALLMAIAECPKLTFQMLDLVTAADRRLIMRVNATGHEYPGNLRLEQLFTHWATRTPDAKALVDECESLTYAEFVHRVDQFAQVLWNQGIRCGDHVGVLLPRGLTCVVAIYGVLRVGAVYVPLDTGDPHDRIEFILADGDISLLIADRTVSASLRRLQCPVVYPGDTVVDIEVRDASQWTAASADPAYIIYTSGSTGRPKGVVVEHRSVVNLVMWMQREYPIGPGDVAMHKTPLTFDASVLELFWWGSAGATLYLLEPGGEKNPGVIARAVEGNRICTLEFVPSMLDLFLDHVDHADPPDLGSLRLVTVGGEALTESQVSRFHDLIGSRHQAQLINTYGPTEASVEVTHCVCADPRPRLIPIGRPIDNVRLYVVDDRLQVRPVGAIGELCIAGLALAREYYGQQDLTAERFVVGDSVGEDRIYRTGDVARLLPSGEFEYLGRLDQQIKIRGMRVELAEIEHWLRQHPAVDDALVIPFGQNGRIDNLCAYLILHQPVRSADLRSYLEDWLPPHMVPLCFAALSSFPLSPSGKRDRWALPPVDVAQYARVTELAPTSAVPATPQAQSDAGHDDVMADPVSRAWSQILGIPTGRLSPEDNFYDLGGTSLLVLRLLDALDGRVSLEEILRAPNLAHLRELFEARSGS